eukprot:scaffold5981_cov146-Skeletonema_dohrnii-CCMP3373.AAC.7
MSDATFTSSEDVVKMDRRLLEQLLMLMLVDSLWRKDKAGPDGDGDDDALKEMAKAKEGIPIMRIDQSVLSETEKRLAVTQRLLDVQFLRLMDEREEGRATVKVVESDESSSDEQLEDDAAAAKKKKRAAAAAAAKKKKRYNYKRNKAAAKHKKAKPVSWMGGGLMSHIMMVAFGSIATFVVPLSLIRHSDGSGEGEAPPVLPPSASRSLPQTDIRLNNDNVESASSSFISPLPAVAAGVVPPPIFSPTSIKNHRMESDEMRARILTTSTCLDTPNWKDKDGYGCDRYKEYANDYPGCPDVDVYAGDMGPPSKHCCVCGGGSHTLPPTISPTISSSPTKSAAPSSSPTASSLPTMSAHPTHLCLDTPNWKDKDGYWCDGYKEYANNYPGCPNADVYAGDMGPASKHCCVCGGGSRTLPPTISPKPSGSPTMSAHPTQFCLDTPNWKDIEGYGCVHYEKDDDPGCPKFSSQYAGDMGPATEHCCYCGKEPCIDTPNWNDGVHGCAWYEENDSPGCPKYGELFGEKVMGLPIYHCCYCMQDVVALVTSPSGNEECVDTPEWEDSVNGFGCDWFRFILDFPEEEGCSASLMQFGEMGSATENCCQCGGGSRSCEDFKSKCEAYFNIIGILDGVVSPFCKKAETCSCEATAADVDQVIIEEYRDGILGSVDLYNECKCDFWSHLCEDTGVGEACDYAAEYCCGDYGYHARFGIGNFLNSPTCYCDFYKYAQNEFKYTLKPKALMHMNKKEEKEFPNPCDIVDAWRQRAFDTEDKFERPSLEAIYERTNGQNWTNSAGWMNEEDHCEWYGIICDGNGQVTSINLRDNNLAGQFPVYTRIYTFLGAPSPTIESDWQGTKYGLANLFRLKTLDLADNKLTGTIEYRPLYNLRSLTHFDVSGNQLGGEVNALVSPSVTHADFSNNRFTSMQRFDMYKVSPLQTLSFCDVSNNAIQNNATDIFNNIPPNIKQFFGANNRIYGSLPASLKDLLILRQFDMSSNALSGGLPEWLNNLPQLRRFNMSFNALSGELPDFAESVLSLQELDLSKQTNGFTGPIPEDIWRFQSLKILNLADNQLARTIPPAIGNMAVLEVLDLSNNLLKSSIPAELGMLEGILKHLRLANNTLSGIIPSEIGQFTGASILLKDNRFKNSSNAPLSLCIEREVKEFDLANDKTLCPIERNALSDFYDSAKGVEWTDGSLWLDEYASYCKWTGVACNDMNRVTKLNLTNNGLSGRLSKSIGNLSFIEVMDLSDNDMKGSIPTEIGLLSNLTYLRLSYNAFTGAAPEGLGELTRMQLLQLQSNRITEIPNIPQLDKSIYKNSTFVTDCGVPSAFDEALECDNSRLTSSLHTTSHQLSSTPHIGNANEDCYPQEETLIAEHFGLNFGTFAAVLFASFIVLCCIVVLCSYFFNKRKNRGNTLTASTKRRLEEDDNYALSRIGKNSVGILVFFILASETNLQDDKIEVRFTWKCPRDSDVCKNNADLDKAGWVIFSVLMTAALAKDLISGSKLIYHSSKVRHSRGSRIRYFIGGMWLCSITLYALYVSTVYNKAIATSNTEIIVNSVIVLFVMDLDEWIFAALEACKGKWTAHTSDSEAASDAESKNGSVIDEMKREIALQKAQLESQQVELTSQQDEIGILRSKQEDLMLQMDQVARQNDEITMLLAAVQKMQESLAASPAPTASESIPQCAANEIVTPTLTDTAESDETILVRTHMQEGESRREKTHSTSSSGYIDIAL